MSGSLGVWWRVALALSIAFFFLNLNYAPLWNPDEGRYAAASLEMAQPFQGAPDWVVPHLNSVPRLNKPPLVYWTTASIMRVLGANEISARLTSAISAFLVLIIVWQLGRHMFGPRAALLAAMVWATAIFPFALARVLNTDMLLCVAITIVIGGVWMALETGRWTLGSGPQAARFNWRAALLSGVGMGMGLLAKGPVAIALPLLIGFAYLFARNWRRGNNWFIAIMVWLSRTWRDLRRDKALWMSLLIALTIGLAMAMPWVWAVSQRVPNFLRTFLLNENLARFSGGADYHDPTPFWYYVPVIIVGLLPWPAFLLWSRVQAVKSESSSDTMPIRATRFLWLWVVIVVGIFSLSSTKLVTYVLPAFPALALLIGVAFDRALERRPGPMWWPAIAISLAFNIILAVTALVYLTNDKTLPRSEALPYALALAVVMIVVSVLLWLAARGGDVRRVFGVQWATAMLFHALLLPIAGQIGRYEDVSAMLRSMKPFMRSDDLFVMYHSFQPTAMFYFQRPIPIVDFYNSSGLDETAIARSKYFWKGEEHPPADVLKRPERVFMLLRWNDPDLRTKFQGFHRVGADNDFLIVSNRPAQPELSFLAMAPRKLEERAKAYPELRLPESATATQATSTTLTP
ncbi:MAG: hypothetical protein JWN98_343 [Abditibacteriota bacterium]|nr:hypothetical protein [Abditibacteriota bacterium]